MTEISEVMISIHSGHLEINDGTRKFPIAVWRLGDLRAAIEDVLKNPEQNPQPACFNVFGTNVSGCIDKEGENYFYLNFKIGNLLVSIKMSPRQLTELDSEILNNWPK